MSGNKEYEVIIVGAGSMGMAAGYFLARQSVKTLLIDAFNPPHKFGSHHGETRIIRHAYGEGRQYVSLALRAQNLWRKLEKESGQQLFEKTGVLVMGERQSAFLKETIESADHFSLPVQVMTAKEVGERWPGISLPEDFVGCLETTSGVLYSEKCIESYKNLALKQGAELLVNTPVEKIGYDSGKSNEIRIQTKDGDLYAKKVIITSGAWTAKILNRLRLPLQPVRKVFAWFETDPGFFSYPDYPAFSFDFNNRLYYGFPSIADSGIKVGRHDSGQKVDPDKLNRNFGDYRSDENDLRFLLNRYMPRASGKLKNGKVCMYTRTPDGHFILDFHPENSNIVIGAGFSGHGFKFSSVVGEILSQMVLSGGTEHDISHFSLSRPALK